MDAREFEPRPRRNMLGWLLPLLIGIGLGALLFAGPRPGWARAASWFDRDDERHAMMQRHERGDHFGSRGDDEERAFLVMERGWRGGWFFPLGFARLLVPLALIGAGTWLLRGGRRPGSPTGGATPPAPGASDPPPNDPDPPATGPTRML